MKKNEKNEKKDKKERKNEQRKSAQSDIFKACSDIVYYFLLNPKSELSAKEIQNKVLQNKNSNKDSTETEISSNVYRKALLYLSNDVYFLDKQESYGKYALSDSITTFNQDEVLAELKIDKNKLNKNISIINGNNELQLVIPKDITSISLKAQKLCSLFRGNDTSILSDVFQSAFTDFSISNFKGFIGDVFLGTKLYKCFHSNERLMPVLLQIIKYKIKIDIYIKIDNTTLDLKNILLEKVEVLDEYLYLITDSSQIRLNQIGDIQKIKLISKHSNYTKTGQIIINRKNILDTLKEHQNYPMIENKFNKFKEDYGFDNSISFEDSFLNLIKSYDGSSDDKKLNFIEQSKRYVKGY